MLRFLMQRLLALIPVLFVVAVVVFLILRLTPGDPAAVIAGNNATNEDIDRIREQLGLTKLARTNAPHSATAQFFINVVDNGFLDPSPQQPGYTVFGKVVSGMETVQKIRSVPTGFGGPFPTDVPQTPIVIQSARML